MYRVWEYPGPCLTSNTIAMDVYLFTEIFVYIMSFAFAAILGFIVGHETGCDDGYRRAQQDYYDATASE